MSRRRQSIDVQSSPVVAPERNVTGTLQARLAARKSVTTNTDSLYNSSRHGSPKQLPSQSLAASPPESPQTAPVERKSRPRKKVLKKKKAATKNEDTSKSPERAPSATRHTPSNNPSTPSNNPKHGSNSPDVFALEQPRRSVIVDQGGSLSGMRVRSGSVITTEDPSSDSEANHDGKLAASKVRGKKKVEVEPVQYPFVMNNNTEVCSVPPSQDSMEVLAGYGSDEKVKPSKEAILHISNHVLTVTYTDKSKDSMNQIQARVLIDNLKITITHQTKKYHIAILCRNNEDIEQVQRIIVSHLHFISPNLEHLYIPLPLQRVIVMPLVEEPGTLPSGVSQDTDITNVEHLPKPGFFSRLVGRILRKKVSKKKRRFVTADMDLDQTYITPQVIAMGFPAEGKEALIRNPMEDVQRFLQSRHKSHKVYNLCSEREYDGTVFDNFLHFPFNDHYPCTLSDQFYVLDDMVRYFKDHPKGTVSVHCKAGKGRTGTIICSFLLYTGCFQNTVDSLKYYGNNRTHNGEGITIPSQARLVYQLEKVLKNQITQTRLPTVYLGQLTMCSGPQFDEIAITCNGFTHTYSTSELNSKSYMHEHKHSSTHTHLCHISDEHDTSECRKPRLSKEQHTYPGIGDCLDVECTHKHEVSYVFPTAKCGKFIMTSEEKKQVLETSQNYAESGTIPNGVELQGDFLVQCLFKKKVVAMTSLNTHFIPAEQYRVMLTKENIDIANKQKKLADFSMELFFFAK